MDGLKHVSQALWLSGHGNNAQEFGRLIIMHICMDYKIYTRPAPIMPAYCNFENNW